MALLTSFLALQPQIGRSCTRCIYLGPSDTVLVARSMDWVEDPGTEIYSFPRGMSRNGVSGPNTLSWTSKYGSLTCSFYGEATVDGINEKGLVANTLYLVEKAFTAGNRVVNEGARGSRRVLRWPACVARASPFLRNTSPSWRNTFAASAKARGLGGGFLAAMGDRPPPDRVQVGKPAPTEERRKPDGTVAAGFLPAMHEA